jgi:long-chain-fatty-acid--[acyl-carrier-protein] ligase
MNIFKVLYRKLGLLEHHLLLPLRYKIEVEGRDKIKYSLQPGKGTLFLSNHTSNVDPPLVLYYPTLAGLNIIIWAVDYVFKLPYLRYASRHIDKVRIVKVPDTGEHRSLNDAAKIHKLVSRTVEGLNSGVNFLIFPAGHSKRSPYEELGGNSAVHRILQLYPDVNIVFIRHVGLWGSRFSRAGKRNRNWITESKRWNSILWSIFLMFAFNLIFFIPKRRIIEFVPAPPDFPRRGTRQEINRYLENFYNSAWGPEGEPLYRVPDYFWKPKYTENAYHIVDYRFDLNAVPDIIKNNVIDIIAKKAHTAPQDITPKMELGRNLGLDSLEITDLLIELELKYQLPKNVTSQVISVGQMMALAAKIPIHVETKKGVFRRVIQQEPPLGFIGSFYDSIRRGIKKHR